MIETVDQTVPVDCQTPMFFLVSAPTQAASDKEEYGFVLTMEQFIASKKSPYSDHCRHFLFFLGILCFFYDLVYAFCIYLMSKFNPIDFGGAAFICLTTFFVVSNIVGIVLFSCVFCRESNSWRTLYEEYLRNLAAENGYTMEDYDSDDDTCIVIDTTVTVTADGQDLTTPNCDERANESSSLIV